MKKTVTSSFSNPPLGNPGVCLRLRLVLIQAILFLGNCLTGAVDFIFDYPCETTKSFWNQHRYPIEQPAYACDNGRKSETYLSETLNDFGQGVIGYAGSNHTVNPIQRVVIDFKDTTSSGKATGQYDESVFFPCTVDESNHTMAWVRSADEPIFLTSGFQASPLLILAVSVFWVVYSIARLKVHPFLSLMSAAILVGLCSGPLPDMSVENKGLFHNRVNLPDSEAEISNPLLAVKWTLLGFGNTAGGIGLVIALAAIVGTCMMRSGAAERVVRHMLNLFGEKRAGLVLLISGFLLSIPVFFDTVFFLLIPLARSISVRAGGKFLYFVMVMAGAGAITHSLVPPTPGPLMIAEILSIELGYAITAGVIVGIPVAALVLLLSQWFDKKYGFPMRTVSGTSADDLRSILEKKDEELPPLFFSYLPILFPILLISSISLFKVLAAEGYELGVFEPTGENNLWRVLSFLGEPNMAMCLSALVSLWLLVGQSRRSEEQKGDKLSTFLAKQLEGPLSTAGMIILITGAGGAFGGMIRLSGVGSTIASLATSVNLSYVLLAWGMTAFIRIAQGSATVAMITGVGLMASIVGDGSALSYHPVYIFLAIGFGSITLSWMNDSGFWVVQRLSGLTERETLQTWSVLLTAISLSGLILTFLGSMLLPMK